VESNGKRDFTVRIPGSTSNLGPGFDTVSAALSLYLTLGVERTTTEIIEWPADWVLKDSENMILASLRQACRWLGIEAKGLRFTVDNEIPLKRGLGSSAAAIIGGIKVAEHLAGRQLEDKEIFQIAYPLEKHPDNLAASLLGGWTISRTEGSAMEAERLPAKLDCRFVVAIPETVVSTEQARSILPSQFGIEDVVFNLQRSTLLVHAVTSGRKNLLSVATQDRLHQPYRASLVPGLPAVLAREALPAHVEGSLLSVTVSGSGSTVLAIADGHWEELGTWMASIFGKEGIKSEFRILDLETSGAAVV